MKKVLLYLLIVAVVAMLVIAGLQLRQQRQQELAAAAPPTPAPWSVHTAMVERGRATRGFPALALIKGANEVTLAAQLGGILLEMQAREGQRVEAGELLARIDTRELQDTLASLEAQRQGAVADAERKLRDARRSEDLLKSRTVSEAQADQNRTAARAAQEQVRSLEKQIAAARTRLGYARIEAPFAGVIAARLADPGDLASVGTPLYRLIDTASARLEVRLPAAVLEQVAPGSAVAVSHHDREMILHADRVFPSVDERSLGRLEIDVPELPFGLPPGTLVHARVITGAIDDALLVPADALLVGADQAQGQVLKIEPGTPAKVRRVPVAIRLRAAEGVAVTGELAAGDTLVTAHETVLRRLRNGDPVRPAEDLQ